MAAGQAARPIRRGIQGAVGLQAVAFVLLAPGVDTPPLVAVLAALCLLTAALLWQLGMSRAREDDLFGKTRWLTPLVLLFAGLGVYVGSVVPGSRLGALGLTGVCAFLIGAGQLLAEVRKVAAPGFGARICAGCAVAFFAALGAFLIEPAAPWGAAVGLGLAFSTPALVFERGPRTLVIGVACALAGALALADTVVKGALVAWVSCAVALAALFLVAPVGLTLASEAVLNARERDARDRFGLHDLASALLHKPAFAVPNPGRWWTALVAVLQRPWTPWAAVPALILVALAGALLVLVNDFRQPVTIALSVGVLVLVLGIASSTQGDVLLLAIIVMLFTILTTVGEAENELTPRGREPTLVALGDSYISGEGAEKFIKGTNDAGHNQCRRSPTAYPYIVVDGERKQTDGRLTGLAFFACSGATTETVLESGQYDEKPQLEQLKDFVHEHGKPRLVAVSIGGNDAGFANIAKACIAPGSCAELGEVWLDRLPNVAQKVRRVYDKVREVVGKQVPVLAVPYPEPIGDVECPYWHPLKDERRLLSGFGTELNRAVKWAAGKAGVHYLDKMARVLKDNELRLCDSENVTEIGVNAIRADPIRGAADQILQPWTWLHNSLHPNKDGHMAMAGVLGGWIDDPDPPPDPPRGAFVPATLREAMAPEAPGRHCHDEAARPCDRGDTLWALTQVAREVLKAAPLLLLIVTGSWLIWLAVLERTRAPLRKFGRETLGPALLGRPHGSESSRNSPPT
jgi:lysophospholipase L1-like esterase